MDDDCPTDSEQLELAVDHVKSQLKKVMPAQNLTSEESSSSSLSCYEKISYSNLALTRTQSLTSPDVLKNNCKSSCSSGNRWLDDRQLIKKLDFNSDSYDNSDEYGSQFSLSNFLK